MKALLDTHVLIFWVSGQNELSEQQSAILAAATPENPMLISDITLWEVATLHSLGRITLDRPLRDWLEQAVAPPLVHRVGISPAVAAEIAALPDSFHRDPGDRIIVASARVVGASLLTNDLGIIQAGIVETI